MSKATFDASEYPKGFAGFWDSLRARKISFPCCQSCGEVHWYPMALCPHCYSDKLGWRAIAGEGSLYSWTTVLRTMSPDMPAPYTVALVEFAEVPGVRLISNVIEVAPEKLSFGMRLEPVFVVEAEEMPLVRFRPSSGMS